MGSLPEPGHSLRSRSAPLGSVTGSTGGVWGCLGQHLPPFRRRSARPARSTRPGPAMGTRGTRRGCSRWAAGGQRHARRGHSILCPRSTQASRGEGWPPGRHCSA